jgi:hypothetical protein
MEGGSARRRAATYTGRRKHRKKYARMRFKAKIQILEEAKTFHALGHTS